MKSSWNDLVEVTCPVCGLRRNAERRNRGTTRICSSCSIGSTKRANDWSTKHGETKTALYKVWHAMLERCRNPNNEYYYRYGGRGITVCSKWQEYVPFAEWARTNGYQKGLYLDRENNDGNYGPDNCRWVISGVSAYNRPTTKRHIADVAVMKELATLGLATGFIAALYNIEPRRVSDFRHGKKFGWVNPTVDME
jgi:hypothetical protein